MKHTSLFFSSFTCCLISGSLVAQTPDPRWITADGFQVEIVASGFQLPVDVAFVPEPGDSPDCPLLYVAELYGAVKVMTNDGTVSTFADNLLNFNPTGNFPGSGEKGIGGIVVDPDSGDVLITRPNAENPSQVFSHNPQVVRLKTSDGLTMDSEEVILDISTETQGPSHQISQISFGPDGLLYVNNGDGFMSEKALDLDSFLGKVLRLNPDGSAPTDNPFYDPEQSGARNYIYAYGFRNPFGGAWRDSGQYFTVENGPAGNDRLAYIRPGLSYGWNGELESMTVNAAYNWTVSTAPVKAAFVQPGTFGGGNFPEDRQGKLYVTLSGGTWRTGPQDNAKRIVEFDIDENGEVSGEPKILVNYNGTGKASVIGLAAGPDGLYFTDFYKDLDYESPIDPGANLLRVVAIPRAEFSADPLSSESAPLTVSFTDESTVENIDSWSWNFGDGTDSSLQNPQHTYQESGTYDVSLTVTAEGESFTTTKPRFIRVAVCEEFLQDAGPQGLLVIEAESFTNQLVAGTGIEWVPLEDLEASGGVALQALPDTGVNIGAPPFDQVTPRLDYPVRFQHAGLHRVWIRGQGSDPDSDSIHIGLNGEPVASTTAITNFSPLLDYQWSSMLQSGEASALLNIPEPGDYVINAWMREDGFLFDKLLIARGEIYSPPGSGPAESIRCDQEPAFVTPDPLIQDDFTGYSGELIGENGGSGWLSPWNADGVSPSISLADLGTIGTEEGNPPAAFASFAEGLRTIPTIGGEASVYISFLIRPTLTGSQAPLESFGGVGLFNGATETFLIGNFWGEDTWAAGSSDSGVELVSSQTVLLCLKADQTTGDYEFWVNPDYTLPEADQTPSATGNSKFLEVFDTVRLRNYSAGGHETNYRFDNLKIYSSGATPFEESNEEYWSIY